MSTSPQRASATPPADSRNVPQASLRAERAYQGLTIAAVLLLLATLWLFR